VELLEPRQCEGNAPPEADTLPTAELWWGRATWLVAGGPLSPAYDGYDLDQHYSQRRRADH